jgi:hypothetical protein
MHELMIWPFSDDSELLLVLYFGCEAGGCFAEGFAFSGAAGEEDFTGGGMVGEAEGFVLHHVSWVYVSIIM